MRVAVVGATGLVGREVVSLLDEREFPVEELLLYASEHSEGETLSLRGEPVTVRRLPAEPPTVDLAVLCATAEVSRKIAGALAAKGGLVLDLAPDSPAKVVPLGAAAVEALRSPAGTGRVLAVPDPLARLVAAPLRALGSLGRAQRAVVTLLVSASARGRERIEALGRQTVSLLNAQSSSEDEEAEAIAFACIPEDASAPASIAARVEGQVQALLAAGFPLVVSVVQTPTFVAHVASIAVEIDASFSAGEARKALREAPSLLVAEPGEGSIGTRDVAGSEAIHVVGLRQNPSDPRWLQFWAMADNIRQGAALAAVSLAEGLLLPARGQAPGKAPGG